jgi:hypothetical protein
MKRLLILLFLLVMVQGAVAAEPSGDQAVASAKEWLSLIDVGDYAASWADASTLFESSNGRDQWVESVGGIRKKLGPLKSRQYQSVELSKTLQNAPEGDYATVSFKSVFTNRADTVEVITLTLEYGRWKGAGYYMK